jgi:hypothetical protein
MTSPYFQKINISEPMWNLESIDLPEPTTILYERHFRNVEDIIPKDFINKFSEIDLVPQLIRVFVWPRNNTGVWHIDGTSALGRNVALNWVIKGSGVIQFNTKLPLSPMYGVHSGRRPSIGDAIEAETFGHGCLINTGIGHRVVTGEEGRTTISLAYTHRDMPFFEMVEKFRQINII